MIVDVHQTIVDKLKEIPTLKIVEYGYLGVPKQYPAACVSFLGVADEPHSNRDIYARYRFEIMVLFKIGGDRSEAIKEGEKLIDDIRDKIGMNSLTNFTLTSPLTGAGLELVEGDDSVVQCKCEFEVINEEPINKE